MSVIFIFIVKKKEQSYQQIIMNGTIIFVFYCMQYVLDELNLKIKINFLFSYRKNFAMHIDLWP